MRILALSDLHFNRQQLGWVTLPPPGFDLVVIAGDLLDLAGHRSLPDQVAEVRDQLIRLRATGPLLVASGNHDADRTSADGEQFAGWVEALKSEGITPDGGGFDLGADRLTVFPWWNGPTQRARLVDHLERERSLVRGRWIWVHHAPPRGSRIAWTRRGDAGDPFLSKLIGAHQPAAVLCGHIHEAPFHADGAWCEQLGGTWVFNPGRQPGEVPAWIALDLAAGTAEYRNCEGAQTVELGWATA